MFQIKSIATALIFISSLLLSAQNKKIDLVKSSIEWTGSKITGQHYGAINFKSGQLIFSNNQLSGGSFIVDMKTIVSTDLTGRYKEKLEGYLKADEFFGVEKHPAATLNFTKIVAQGKGVYDVTANLIIKEITKPVNFTLTVSETGATTKFTVNRTIYNIVYRSRSFFEGIGDDAVADEFELKVNLKF